MVLSGSDGFRWFLEFLVVVLASLCGSSHCYVFQVSIQALMVILGSSDGSTGLGGGSG